MARTELEQLQWQMSVDIRHLMKQNERAVANVRGSADKMEARYKALSKVDVGKFMDQTFNRTRLAVFDAGSARIPIFGQALDALGPAGMAAAAGVAAVGLASQQAIAAMKFADEIDDASQKLNIGTDALQEYRFAMTEAGGETTDADKAIESFTKTLGLAQSGLSPKAMKGFAALGFTKAQLDQFNSGEEALAETASRVAALSKESERAAVAEKLGLGPMLPLLREGAERMEELRQKAHDLGYVMDADLVKKGADANQQFETMSKVIDVQLKSSFVELSDEVLTFTGTIAGALRSLNDFLGAYDTFTKINPNGMWSNNAGAAFGYKSGLWDKLPWMRGFAGRLHEGEAWASANADDPALMRQQMAVAAAAAPRNVPDTRLAPTGRPGGGRSSGASDSAREEARRLERLQSDLKSIQDSVLTATERAAQDLAKKVATVREAVAAGKLPAEEAKKLEAAVAGIDLKPFEAEPLGALGTDAVDLQRSLDEGDRSRPAVREVGDIVGGLQSDDDQMARTAEMYAEIDRLRQADLISEQDAQAAKAEVGRRYDEARLSGAYQFFGQLADLQGSSVKELAAIGKAAALVQAGIDARLAILAAWRSAPFPFNLPAVAITTATTAAHVAAIAGMADGGWVGGSGGPRQDNQIRALSVGEHVTNARAAALNGPMLDFINGGGNAMQALSAAASAADGIRARRSAASLTFSPAIDARGMDWAGTKRLERIMDDRFRQFETLVRGATDRRDRFRLGQHVDD